MREIEIRRHCFTKKGEGRGHGSHLSADGVTQARQIGGEIGPFDLVLTSSIPRTLETALAMGFAVDDQWEGLGDIPKEVWDEIGHQERWEWQDLFLQFSQLIASGGPTGKMGQRQKQLWTQALESAPTGGKVLIISHGRVIESGLAACLPEGNFASWGSPFHHGEGVRMEYSEGRFFHPELRRCL